MHLDHDHIAGGHHDHGHSHTHTHEHTHDGVAHTHEHSHPHDHDALHGADHSHEHFHDCSGACSSCQSGCSHTPMEELTALMKYMANHNAAHARELAALAAQLEKAGNHMAYEQVMAAVSDYEKGNLRLSAVLASLEAK